jgi:sugar lactone lactonase YvrE
MYYVDSHLDRVDAFDYNLESGEIENRRVAFAIPEEEGSWPEGMTIDSEGMLWVVLGRGSKVTRWHPEEGRLLQTVDVPAPTTSCAFGGPNLDQLYITTRRRWLKPEALEKQPLAGGLFRADVGVTGVPAFEFAG